MKKIIFTLLISLYLPAETSLLAQILDRSQKVRFLALGDSYTIGQSVDFSQRWPVQLGKALTEKGLEIEEITIIAQTGWRTDQLINAINSENPTSDYHLVSLLIGVNNQFQGGTIETYRTEFEELLTTAIRLAQNDPKRVMVLSIPDYAYTPFGNGSAAISEAIDLFNAINRQISNQYNIAYHNITPISRQGLNSPSLVAEDNLHPSGEMYALWVNEIMSTLQISNTTSLNSPKKPPVIQSFAGYFTVNTPNKEATLAIYNMGGVKIFQQNHLLPQHQHTIYTNFLPRGLYLVTLENNGTLIKATRIKVF